jgi:hypothetical protein
MTCDLRQLAAAIRSATHGSDCSADLVAATRDPVATRGIVHAMSRFESELGHDDSSRMSRLLSDLESLAIEDDVTACCMMPYLWELASDVLGAHDVTGAVDLWLAQVLDPRIAIHVQYLAENGADVYVREHFQRLVGE